MGRLGRRLGKLEGTVRVTASKTTPAWDLEALDDDELTELDGLVRKADEAKRAGRAVEWTADEARALLRLKAKVRRDEDVTVGDGR